MRERTLPAAPPAPDYAIAREGACTLSIRATVLLEAEQRRNEQIHRTAASNQRRLKRSNKNATLGRDEGSPLRQG